jgi:hypothetical protein
MQFHSSLFCCRSLSGGNANNPTDSSVSGMHYARAFCFIRISVKCDLMLGVIMAVQDFQSDLDAYLRKICY